MAADTLHRIDTHHHILPPAYLEAHRDDIAAIAAEFATQVLGWSPSRSLDAMDQAGVATAVTSISAPGIWFGDVGATRGLARECNDYAARLAGDHKGRFASFAALPLPDVDGSLREIDYACDTLGAAGFGLMTNYGDLWPGDPVFAPVFDELNRRRAAVYFHPVAAACCGNLLAEVPSAIIEYPFDTTRAITSLLYSGTFSRCPDIRFLFSHGGGALAVLAHRIARYADIRQEVAARLPNGAMPELKKLYYDVVSITNPIAFGAIRNLVGLSQLLFGSDFPYWSPEMTVKGLAGLGLTAEERRAVEGDNARALLGAALGPR